MYTGAPEIRFSHPISDVVRESYSPRGKTSFLFSHSLIPIGERNRFADLEATERRALAKAIGGGGC